MNGGRGASRPALADLGRAAALPTTLLLKIVCWCGIVVALAALAWNDPRRGLAKLRKAVVLTLGQRPVDSL